MTNVRILNMSKFRNFMRKYGDRFVQEVDSESEYSLESN